MKSSKKISLKWKISLPTIALFFVSITVILTVVLTIFYITSTNLSKNYTIEMASNSVGIMSKKIERLSATASTNAKIIETMLSDEHIQRSEIINILGKVVLSQDEFTGIGIMMEQDIFPEEDGYNFDDNLFHPYIYKSNDQFYFESVGSYNEYIKEDYFKIPKQTGKLYITDPYFFNVNGEKTLMITISVPIFYNGKFAGTIGHDIDVRFFNENLSNIRIFDSGFVYLISPNKYLAYYPNTDDDIGKLITESSWKNYPQDIKAVEDAINTKKVQTIKSWDEDIGEDNLICYYIPYYFADSDKPWVIGAAVIPSEANYAINLGILTGVLLGVIAAVLSFFALIYIIGKKIKPLNRIAGIVSRMVETGDMSVNLSANDISNDEVGLVTTSFIKLTDMMNEWNDIMKKVALGDFSINIVKRSDKDEFSNNINLMIESNKSYIHNISKVMSEFSSGNLSAKIDMEYGGDFAPIKKSINNTMTQTKGYVEEISKILYQLKEGILTEHLKGDFAGDFNTLKTSVNDMINSQRSYISEISRVMGEMKEGKLDVSIDTDFHGDFEPIKTSVNETIEFLKSYINDITRILGLLANKDLTCKLNMKFKGDFKVLEESLDKIVIALNQTLKEIKGAASLVTSGSNQISSGSQELSYGAIQQNDLLKDLSNTTMDIVSKAKISSENAKTAVKMSEEATMEVKSSNEKMHNLVEAMSEINTTSGQISTIIRAIQNIAFQTNLLSLNASIEATKAGEAGKGFSVVAEKVRALANNSSAAAKDTTQLIEKSLRAVKHGNQLTQETALSLTEVLAKTQKTGDLVNEIVQATNEQLSGTNAINSGIEQILDVVQSNSATAESAAASSEELFAQAETLNNLIDNFKV